MRNSIGTSIRESFAKEDWGPQEESGRYVATPKGIRTRFRGIRTAKFGRIKTMLSAVSLL